MKILFQLFAHLFLIIGIIGIFVPILPTTPFLLLATYLYSKSNPKIYRFILNHKYLGPPVKDWQERGVVGVKAKILATTMIALVAFFRIPFLEVHLIIKVLAEIILISLIIFLISRPSK